MVTDMDEKSEADWADGKKVETDRRTVGQAAKTSTNQVNNQEKTYVDPCGILAQALEEEEEEEEEEKEEEPPPPPLSPPPPPPPRLEARYLLQAGPRVGEGDVLAREGEEEVQSPSLPPPPPSPPPTLSPPASDVSAPGRPPTSPARAPRAAAAAAMKNRFNRGRPAEREGLRPRSSSHRRHCCRFGPEAM
ncbi:caskin-1-like [Neofelis nebulosa]|uniref:caskin-1-like n=1 Tax=Neofelis nebulosa TaxID=61452 RepID=UPI002729E8E0|nr:caskin-1-like [Neofelis nebulosa]